jgi:NAD(P)-dependent dehydrogenase (short-subunit alcohol dehydrogenase family)
MVHVVPTAATGAGAVPPFPVTEVWHGLGMKPLAGRVALVTGASRGIGAAIAIRLAAEGAAVAVVARTLWAADGESLEGTIAQIERVGGRGVPVVADLADADAVSMIVPEVEAGLGSVDVLINNAGIALYRPITELASEDLRRLMAVNYLAPVELARSAVVGMRARGRGWIVNISSVVAGHAGAAPFDAVAPLFKIGWHYGATKAALERFTTGFASEVFGDGIAVNALLPVAGVLTPGYGALASRVTPRPDLLEPVEQMAEAALLLASVDPAVLTGRIVTSAGLLDELGVPMKALNGSPFSRER